MTSSPIDFYFDFSSPYGYLASTQVDDIGSRHDRKIVWRPYLMGAAFKITGRAPLVNHPLVAGYALLDLQRSARLLDISFNMPDKFPVTTVAACRAYYWLHDQDKGMAKQFAKHIYHAYFVDGQDISKRSIVIDETSALDIDAKALDDALTTDIVKQRLRVETDNALNKNVFGSPYFIVDGEPFWGNDRLTQLETWLERKGW